VGWKLFVDSKLIDHVCPTDADAQLLRQIVVNCVMATDIVDRNLTALRNARWDAAFENAPGTNSIISNNAPEFNDSRQRDDAHKKTTIVLEVLIQAADVSHTMQHWHVILQME
jgi:hypothetical protein